MPETKDATMRTTLSASPCTNCGKQLDAALMVGDDGSTPQPGDITLCAYCSHVMAFAEDLTVRELTDDEILIVAGDKRLLIAQDVVARAKARRLQ